MNTHEIGKQLENYVVNKFLEMNIFAKRTKGSGNKGSKGDIQQDYFVCECKKRNTKDITIKKDVWQKLKNEIPLHSQRIPLYCLENKSGDRFAVVDLDDFFDLLEHGVNNA